jgi:putative ABC transport system permease protein
VLAVTLVQVLQPFFNELTGKPLSITLLHTNLVWLNLLGIFIMGAILSGAYPAFVLSSFKPALVLKGKWSGGLSGGLLRKSLVILQFTASVALIVGTFTVYTQLNYMRNKELGMNISQLLVIKAPSIHGDQYVKNVKVFKTEMLRHPAVTQATGSLSIPGIGYNWHSNEFRRQSQEANPINKYNAFYVNNEFFETYQIEFIAGRSFTSNLTQYDNNKEIILNEMATNLLGFAKPADAINQILYNGNTKEGIIVGVVQNYHHESLKSNVEAMVVFPTEWANYFTLRLTGGDKPAHSIQETIEKAKQNYEAFFPGNPFDYFFLDDFFNQKYQADQQFGKVFGLFAALAILVACLGLFGLASFTITQRTKEIGIRKVLGASESNILFLLSKDFATLILLSNLIAWPMAYWGINQWLQNYPYRIGLSPWLFIIPALIVLAIALLTISVQTIRTARSNPVKPLRYE